MQQPVRSCAALLALSTATTGACREFEDAEGADTAQEAARDEFSDGDSRSENTEAHDSGIDPREVEDGAVDDAGVAVPVENGGSEEDATLADSGFPPARLDSGSVPTSSGADASVAPGDEDSSTQPHDQPPGSGRCNGGGPGLSDCGIDEAEDCCQSLLIPRETYDDRIFVVSVSSFRLDRFEVTVGRFRQFVEAAADGWLPDPGSGTHVHLEGGGFPNEPAWLEPWNDLLPATRAGWDQALSRCEAPTWTYERGEMESRPINCLNWYQAYAFCIFDGGFLPTTDEWFFAAAGGREARLYPWGPMQPDSSRAIYDGDAPLIQSVPVGSRSPAGDGRFDQADLSGSLSEWVLGTYGDGAFECDDCLYYNADEMHLLEGGSYLEGPDRMEVWASHPHYPDLAGQDHGVRCARVPDLDTAE